MELIVMCILSYPFKYLIDHYNNKCVMNVIIKNGFKPVFSNEKKEVNILEYMPIINVIGSLVDYVSTVNDPLLLDNLLMEGQIERLSELDKKIQEVDPENIDELYMLEDIYSILQNDNSYYIAKITEGKYELLFIIGEDNDLPRYEVSKIFYDMEPRKHDNTFSLYEGASLEEIYNQSKLVIENRNKLKEVIKKRELKLNK